MVWEEDRVGHPGMKQEDFLSSVYIHLIIFINFPLFGIRKSEEKDTPGKLDMIQYFILTLGRSLPYISHSNMIDMVKG